MQLLLTTIATTLHTAGTIFAYGQTGTGKTHTMEGVFNNPELECVHSNLTCTAIF